MTQRLEFPKRILCQRQSGAVGVDVEGEDATFRVVFLIDDQLWSWSWFVSGARGSHPPCAVVQCPDRLVDVDTVAESVRERWAFRY